MSETALHIEELSKWYRLGTISTGSLRQDVKRWWIRDVLRKKDPFFEALTNPADRNFIWALNDINFEIRQGEVWGFVGSNGAGKSTLLKIISKIVKPTKGKVIGRGTISSLLEVGTGFHEELSGRENIYISGYLLGMKKEDIRRNFDAIVEFSGLANFIDTPVKRYSSGMYVKLAFAIAAHLEPDILIVDEVLAVGDAAFQKKCLGKMNEVSQEKGRTILFVSHNMQAVKQLCTHALWLEKGGMKGLGQADKIINQYITSVKRNKLGQRWELAEAPGNAELQVMEVLLEPINSDEYDSIDIRTPLQLSIKFRNGNTVQPLRLALRLYTYGGDCIFELTTGTSYLKAGSIEANCTIPGNFLNYGSYYFSLFFYREEGSPFIALEECISFEVYDHQESKTTYTKSVGLVRPQFPFRLNELGSEG